MATFVRTRSGKWKAVIRRHGWPTKAKSFRTRQDAEDWARRAEDEMVRGVFICRDAYERMTVAVALDRYAREVTPHKKPSTRARAVLRIGELTTQFGKYSLAAITPELVGTFRDRRLAAGMANNSVRLELALGHFVLMQPCTNHKLTRKSRHRPSTLSPYVEFNADEKPSPRSIDVNSR